MTTGRSLVRGSARTRRSTSSPSTLRQLEIEEDDPWERAGGAAVFRAGGEQVVERLDAVAGDDDPAVARQAGQREDTEHQRHVVGVVLDEQHDGVSIGLLRSADRDARSRRSRLLDRALAPRRAAVAVDDALDGGQADAGARELVAGAAAGRRRKLVGVSHVEAGAVVAHEVDRLAACRVRAELDARPGVLAR